MDKDSVLFQIKFDLQDEWRHVSPVLFPRGFTRDCIDGVVSVGVPLAGIPGGSGERPGGSDSAYTHGDDRLAALKNSRLEQNREHVGRANQTNLSSYFRNMYHLIKYVDPRQILNRQEKIRYINILRAQLSNVVSRFGSKWLENDYVARYRLIKNMPCGFCKPFDHTARFPMLREEDELQQA